MISVVSHPHERVPFLINVSSIIRALMSQVIYLCTLEPSCVHHVCVGGR